MIMQELFYEVDGNSQFSLEDNESLVRQKCGLTAEDLGISLNENEEEFTKQDFLNSLGKVSRKRYMPVGEHIREAIQIIKGAKE